jgi:hypothetical protein
MMQRIHGLFCTVTMALLLVASPGLAAVIEVGYEGTIQGLDAGFAATLPPGSPIYVGAPVIINYAFESTTSDTDASDTSGIYSGAITSFTIYVGAQVFDHDAGGAFNEIDVFLEGLLTIYQPVDSVIASPPLPGFPVLEADVIFVSVAGSPLPDDSLPLDLPDPADTAWDSAEAGISDDVKTLLIDIELTSKCSGACAVPTPGPAPVPSGGASWLTVVLMIVGAGMLQRRYRTA